MVIGLVKLLLIVFMCECAVEHSWFTMTGMWGLLMLTMVFESMLKEGDE